MNAQRRKVHEFRGLFLGKIVCFLDTGLQDAWSKVAKAVPNLVYFLLVLFIGLFVTQIITKVVGKIANRLNFDSLLDKAGIGAYPRRAGLRKTAEGVEGVKVPDAAVKAAPIAIWVVGGFAAIDQLGVAPTTVRTIFTAVMAMIVGIGIVAIGGSGIAALRPRWDTWLNRWDAAKTSDGSCRPLAPPKAP